MRWALAALAALLLGIACSFAPDLSRFPPCGEGGVCAAGSTCLVSEARCIPDCGEAGLCPAPAGDAGPDAGDDGGTDAGVDAGDDGGTDAGTDGGVDGGDAGVALALAPDTLPTGLEGTLYSATLKARGGTPPYAFTTPSALPAGLSLSAEGILSGTPTATGSFNLNIQVEDRSMPPARASGGRELRINEKLRLAGPGILADAPIGTGYEEQLSSTGGIPPYRFSLAEGSTLPSGLSLDTNGRVTGTASGQPVSVTVTARVTDSDTPPQEATRTLAIDTVSIGLLEFRILTRSLPDARSGTPYSYTLRRYAGAQWSVSGPLPPGISFNAADGVLSGTPGAAPDNTTYSFRIILANGLGGTDEEPVSIRVNVKP
ncbi:MAG TPA: Ig domain-containing protein [Myxococcus sp.]|nr:Ig domain-containing protein [Myxococcus sp.]